MSLNASIDMKGKKDNKVPCVNGKGTVVLFVVPVMVLRLVVVRVVVLVVATVVLLVVLGSSGQPFAHAQRWVSEKT